MAGKETSEGGKGKRRAISQFYPMKGQFKECGVLLRTALFSTLAIFASGVGAQPIYYTLAMRKDSPKGHVIQRRVGYSRAIEETEVLESTQRIVLGYLGTLNNDGCC